MKNTRIFQCYSDAGHGWLKVKKSILKELGIAEKITSYSYMKGDWAYLEEDCDAYLFILTLEKLHINYRLNHHYSNLSTIRSYEDYKIS